MNQITVDTLFQACRAGGSSHLTVITEMAPAAGTFASVAPARYKHLNASGATYAFEVRFIDGRPLRCVLIDGKSSQENRVEEPLALAHDTGHPVLSNMPTIRVTYAAGDDEEPLTLSDLELPHRWVDAHVRSGTVDGKPVIEHPAYLAARNAVRADVTPVMHLAPMALAAGSWDSTRKSRQSRYPSILVGEIIGVLADQEREEPIARRSGARVDPVAPGLHLSDGVLKSIAAVQGREKAGKKASDLGLGNIAPGLEEPAGVATSRIIRSHVLSFAGLRRLRFGGDEERDVAARAVLAAVMLWGLVASYEDGYLRANCHLVEEDAPRFVLKGRNGDSVDCDPLTQEGADALLQAAYEAATAQGIDWHGQVLDVVGDPQILASVDTSAEE